MASWPSRPVTLRAPGLHSWDVLQVVSLFGSDWAFGDPVCVAAFAAASAAFAVATRGSLVGIVRADAPDAEARVFSAEDVVTCLAALENGPRFVTGMRGAHSVCLWSVAIVGEGSDLSIDLSIDTVLTGHPR